MGKFISLKIMNNGFHFTLLRLLGFGIGVNVMDNDNPNIMFNLSFGFFQTYLTFSVEPGSNR